MSGHKKITILLTYGRAFSIVIMSCCVILLTAVNFLIYADHPSQQIVLAHNSDTGDEESPVPEEEKSSSKTALTIQEEYIHDLHMMRDLSALEILSGHKIPATEKLQIVHYELISPPPKA